MRALVQRIFDFWWGQGIADDVPALTYYLVLSLGPFALGAAALEALLLEDLLSAMEIAEQLNRFLPETVHGDVERLVTGTRENSPLLIGVAIVAMLWTSSGAIGVIERCESRMLDCPRHGVVLGRTRNLALGALVALVFVVAAFSAPVIGEAAGSLHLRGAIPSGLLFAVNAFGSVAIFALIYRYAPRSRLTWGSSFLGALPAGLAMQLGPVIIGAYFGAAAGFAAVRVFLLLAVLLLALYLMAAVLLVGAGLAVGHERRKRDREAGPVHMPGAPRGLLADGEHRVRAGV